MAVKKTIDIQKIDALSELKRAGVKCEHRGDNEVAFKCPAHKDSSPSAFLNVESNLWKCHAASCGESGDVIKLLALVKGIDRSDVIKELGNHYELGFKKCIEPALIEKYFNQIGLAGALGKELTKRAICKDIIREYRIGYDQKEGRIIIPVYDEEGDVINLRKYKPGAPNSEKMKNQRGMQVKALYPISKLSYDKVIVAAGEMKALLFNHLLNKHGFGAVTCTSGEGAWSEDFCIKFADKDVYICYDVDKGGVKGSRAIAAKLKFYAKNIYVVDLPLDRSKYPKGDINDFVGSAGATEQDVLKCFTDAKPFVPEQSTIDPIFTEEADGEWAKLTELLSWDSKTRFKCTVLLNNLHDKPYRIPGKVAVDCECGRTEHCHECPVSSIKPEENGFRLISIPKTHVELLNMLDSSKKSADIAMRTAAGIPDGCKTSILHKQSDYSVRKAVIRSPLEENDTNDNTRLTAYFVEPMTLEVNTSYEVCGRIHASPVDHGSILLLDKCSKTDDDLDTFNLTEEDRERMSILKPSQWTVAGLQEKLRQRYADLSTNVTGIFGRDDLHLFIDLCYHSCLRFEFNGKEQHGYLELLLIGDSSQGKTEIVDKYLKHYKLGIKKDCKNASVAGLLGGTQQQLGSWYVTWGIVPMCDRRLVIFEEFKGLSVETIGRLTEMRSSGKAEITKIDQQSALARTRKIMISNPRNGKKMSDYNYGTSAIKELVGSSEDIRRFDYAMVLASGQVDNEEINKRKSDRPTVVEEFTGELCRKAILWSWTRNDDQIELSDEVETKCILAASELCSLFSEDVMPLCDRGSMRLKVAKLAIALAALTFSESESMEGNLTVRECHVEFIKEMLKKQYSTKEFGYLQASELEKDSSVLRDVAVIRKCFEDVKDPEGFLNKILYSSEITVDSVCVWTNLDKMVGGGIFSDLVRNNALIRVQNNVYRKSDQFIRILKDWYEKKVFKSPQKRSGASIEEF